MRKTEIRRAKLFRHPLGPRRPVLPLVALKLRLRVVEESLPMVLDVGDKEAGCYTAGNTPLPR